MNPECGPCEARGREERAMKRIGLVLAAMVAVIMMSTSDARAKSATLSVVYRPVGQSVNKVLPVWVETTLSTKKIAMMCVPGTCVATITAPLPGYDYAIYYAFTQGRDGTSGTDWLPEGQLIVNGMSVTMRVPSNAVDHKEWRVHTLKKDGKIVNVAASANYQAIPNQQLVPLEVDAYMTGGCTTSPMIRGDFTLKWTRPT